MDFIGRASRTFPISYEWPMRTLSSHFIPQQQLPQHHRPEEEEEEEEEDKPRCEWDISLISTLVSSSSSPPNSGASDALGVIEFHPTNRVIATGGIARKIRVYSVPSLLAAEDPNEADRRRGDDACDYLICTPAKLSSLRWRPGSGGRVIGSGDYDGVVTEYDLERRVPVFERDEHGGRRVWSLDYSHSDPSLGASGSDDGTMQLWDPRAGKCVATVQPSPARRPVCCVEFSPAAGESSSSSQLVGVGCADRKAYAYDVRRLSEPVVVLEGHGKTVSYVRFVQGKKMVSAGIDGCLKLWDLDKTTGGEEIRSYRGHVNSRSFVGLSVWKEGGLVGCGSENNKVVVYDMRWGEPVWVHGFEPQMGGFVSSVCWAQVDDRALLLAGGSIGDLKVFTATRKKEQSGL